VGISQYPQEDQGNVNVWRSAMAAMAIIVAAVASGCSSGGTYAVNPGEVFNPPSTPTGPAARARVVHASPDVTDVDVLVDGGLVVEDLAYADYTDYLFVESGRRNVVVRTSDGNNTPLINTSLNLTANTSYTVIAADRRATIGTIVMTDDLSAPSAGNVKLRVVHAAPRAGAVDIYVTAPNVDLNTVQPNFSNVTFRTPSGYFQVPTGDRVVRVTAAGSKLPVIDSGTFNVPTGAIRTVVIAGDTASGKALEALVLDDN